MSSGLFATPTPTPYGIPQSDGSGFIDPNWLLRGNFSSPAIFQQTDGTGAVFGSTGVALTLSTQVQKSVWAGPISGANAAPTFRLLASTDIPDLSGVYQPLNAKLTSISALANAAGWLHNDGAGAFAYSTPSKSDVGLGLVENTALSTWAGSANLTTLGAIATGTWNATAIGATKGGTGLATIASGKMLYASALNTFAALSTGNSLAITGGVLDTIQDIRTSASPTFANLSLSQAVANYRVFNFKTAGFIRWSLTCDNAAESGGNAGSNLQISRYSDAGAYISDLLSFNRATGNVGVGTSSAAQKLTIGNAGDGGRFMLLPYSSGDTVGFQFGDAFNSIYNTFGSAIMLDAFHGVAIHRNSGGTTNPYFTVGTTLGATDLAIAIGGATTFSNSIKTASPSGGTAQPWKLGGYTAGVAVQAGKVRVEINGTPYDLLTA